ncbi:hypothetical protein EMPS_05952 [Entomortierella parvispora]|uniref:Xylulose kinase n=1 Tax=Entomortierella parvispora TaxID=205924 RepID=A0A9P3HBE5_9FUNG|nr:hypothetical protein EMPS_05952 [Entomortierella parvispora]
MNTEDHHQPTASPLFIGLDLSTQQLKVVVLELHHPEQDGPSTLESHSTFAVHFDHDLPHFQTRGGVAVLHDTDPKSKGVATTPVLMWVEAIEKVFDKMKQEGFPFERVKAISGAAQQHGSVYWSKEAINALQSMHGPATQNQRLTEILKEAFTVGLSPMWQDTSTSAQCQEIEEFLGVSETEKNSSGADARLLGQQRLAEMTGSRAHERYTASQILKIRQATPEVYQATERISLVSSFVASLLMGKFASIDVADGSGMNLLNVDTKTWDPKLTAFIARGGSGVVSSGQATNEDISNTLTKKLGPVDASGKALQGYLCSWFQERYGFTSDVGVVSFTGDNPAAVLALKAEQGDAIVSLGTSDTLLLYTDNHGQTTDTTHVSEQAAEAKLSLGYLCHPVDPNGFLMLYCAKNGSLARERVRDLYADGKWETFNKYLTEAMDLQTRSWFQQDEESKLGFFFFDREIWPPVQGVYRFENGVPVDEFHSKQKEAAEESDRLKKQANVLCICESQFLAMRSRSSQSTSSSTSNTDTPSPSGISRILATGGAASNPVLLRLLSNVFGVPVVRTGGDGDQTGAGSAAWGAARKACQFGSGTFIRDEQTYGNAIQPDLEQTRRYISLLPQFTALEQKLLS